MIRQLDLASVKAMFSTPVNGTYVPLTLLSFAGEYHFFGLDPHACHGTNLVLHLICTLLVFHLLRRLKLDALYAAFGAVLFGIHPMHVESVAWIELTSCRLLTGTSAEIKAAHRENPLPDNVTGFWNRRNLNTETTRDA